MWEDILKGDWKYGASGSAAFDNKTIQETITKIIEVLGEPDKKEHDIGDRTYIEKGKPYTDDMVYRISYCELYEEDSGIDKIGTLHHQKLDYWGTEKFDINSSIDGYPAYMVGAFDNEYFTFDITIKENNPQIESIVQDLHNHFERKYGITDKTTKPKYTVGSKSPEIGEGEKIDAKDLPIDEWREALRGKE